MIFGRLGDKIGRKHVLVITLVLIGVATVLIGVLPGYATIGVAAPIILVLLRLAQGIGVGGEWGGAVLLSSEFGDPEKRGFWSSAAQIGPPAGNLMANGVLAVLAATLSTEDFLSWGWRVAFLASALLVAFGLLIRLKLEETPVFNAIQAHGEQPKAPIKEVFTKEPRALVAAALSRVGPDVLYSLFTVFVTIYATNRLGMTPSNVLTAILIGSAFQLVLIPAAGALTDRFNRRLVYGIAAVGTAIYIPVFFLMIQGKSGAHADHRRRDRAGVPCLHVRAAGRLHHRAVPGPAALRRQLAGLHPGRSGRRRRCPADLHRPVRRHRQLVPDRRLPGRRRGRDGDRAGHRPEPADRRGRAAPAGSPRLSGAGSCPGTGTMIEASDGDSRGNPEGTRAPQAHKVRSVRAVGTRAVLAELSGTQDVLALQALLLEKPLPGQQDVLAAAETVLVKADSPASARRIAARLLQLDLTAPVQRDGELVVIDTVYDGEDLAAVGRAHRPGGRGRDRRPHRPDLDRGLRRLRPRFRLPGRRRTSSWKCPAAARRAPPCPPAPWRWPATTRPSTRAGPPAAGSSLAAPTP